MVLFIGQVGNDFVEREAFQEIDYRRMYGPLAKWVAQIDRAERIPEYVSHAFHTATAGRPGPVRARAARGHAVAEAAVADAPRYQHGARRAGAARTCDELARVLARRAAAVRDARRRRLDARGVRRAARFAEADHCRSAARSAARTLSTTAIRTTSATSASASTRSSRSACRTPTCCSRSARGSAR